MQQKVTPHTSKAVCCAAILESSRACGAPCGGSGFRDCPCGSSGPPKPCQSCPQSGANPFPVNLEPPTTCASRALREVIPLSVASSIRRAPVRGLPRFAGRMGPVGPPASHRAVGGPFAALLPLNAPVVGSSCSGGSPPLFHSLVRSGEKRGDQKVARRLSDLRPLAGLRSSRCPNPGSAAAQNHQKTVSFLRLEYAKYRLSFGRFFQHTQQANASARHLKYLKKIWHFGKMLTTCTTLYTPPKRLYQPSSRSPRRISFPQNRLCPHLHLPQLSRRGCASRK